MESGESTPHTVGPSSSGGRFSRERTADAPFQFVDNFLFYFRLLVLVIGLPGLIILDMTFGGIYYSKALSLGGDNVWRTWVLPIIISAVTTFVQFYCLKLLVDKGKKWYEFKEWRYMELGFVAIWAWDTYCDLGGTTTFVHGDKYVTDILPPAEARTAVWWGISVGFCALAVIAEPLVMNIMENKEKVKTWLKG